MQLVYSVSALISVSFYLKTSYVVGIFQPQMLGSAAGHPLITGHTAMLNAGGAGVIAAPGLVVCAFAKSRQLPLEQQCSICLVGEW